MNPFLPLYLCLISLFAPAAPLQKSVTKGTLYTRVEGELVQAVLELKVSGGWHLYHTELGGPDATGQPLRLQWKNSEGVVWSEFRLPEPKIHRDLEGGADAWAYVHRGKFLAYAVGRIPTGTELPSGLRLALSGLACEDKPLGVCIPYAEELERQAPANETVFANFPADLSAPESVALSSTTQESAPAATLSATDWEPDYEDAMHAKARAFVRAEGESVRMAIQIAVKEGYHIYHGPTVEDAAPGEFYGVPTTFAISGGNVEWDAVVFPAPVKHEQVIDPAEPALPYFAHEGLVNFSVSGKTSGTLDAKSIAIEIAGQTCDDMGCMLYGETIVPELGGPDELFEAATGTEIPSGVESPSSNVGDLSSMPLFAFLGLAVLWGIITLLMPCTYPMIPITISFFTKQAISRQGKVLPLSLAYGAGIVVIFVLIGVILGPVIITFATHPITNIVIGALFMVFAFSLFGAYELRPPAFLMGAAGQASAVGGVLGVFLLGATLVVTSFTCTAPFVGSLLSIGATGTGSTLRIALGMAVFGLTMAVPFVFLSLLPGKAQSIPKAGEWMHVLKVYLGFVELAAALKFLSNSDLTWGWGILSREVFLVLWAGIFATAAFFLFGRIRLKGESEIEIGPWRMIAGLGNVLLAGYCTLGIFGFQLDDITTAILPNYSSGRLYGSAKLEEHQIVKDDLVAAVELARNEQKLLLINFTGFN